ncbi:antibiotic biosynthesis monooxygenase [Paenibacillus sp. KACC 21273]|uniref:antibiotic biosynthesis monooxygenase family protein n=1 Tax=Paenibacillus sp. KACC 21273 TaxID=3025665 RepID=UPI002367308C|nr:antibiotic biosynthesis monooxygenase [Paenibacillus sp. KACC 21273]WDF49744.1 antibiotic biosynthesis monooxygenase [Paenibacillus sp. KACC 21273]
MILEVANLQVKASQTYEFEQSFRQASQIISSMKGYISHELQRCLEVDNLYLLLVRWETLADHTEGFRGSTEYQEWKKLLHHYYDPFPAVHYYEIVESSQS